MCHEPCRATADHYIRLLAGAQIMTEQASLTLGDVSRPRRCASTALQHHSTLATDCGTLEQDGLAAGWVAWRSD